MRIPAALIRLLHVGLVLALTVGVVLRPSLSELADLHADQHRSLAGQPTLDVPATASHEAHHSEQGRQASADAAEDSDEGHGLHALMHLNPTGGSVGDLIARMAVPAANLGSLRPWRPLPAAAPGARLPNPLRPPIA